MIDLPTLREGMTFWTDAWNVDREVTTFLFRPLNNFFSVLMTRPQDYCETSHDDKRRRTTRIVHKCLVIYQLSPTLALKEDWELLALMLPEVKVVSESFSRETGLASRISRAMLPPIRPQNERADQ